MSSVLSTTDLLLSGKLLSFSGELCFSIRMKGSMEISPLGHSNTLKTRPHSLIHLVEEREDASPTLF